MTVWWAAAALAVLVMAWLGLTGFAWSDYDAEASAAFAALADGDVVSFLQLSPSYGGSLVLRAPFAWITDALGGGELAIFRAVSVPGLLAAAVLALFVITRLRGRGHGRMLCALVLGVLIANPVSLRALEIGHPEELLGAALCVGAVLAAADRRGALAGVLLGLAIATKLWAVLAIGPVLLAAPDRRLRTLIVAGGVAGAVLMPLLAVGGGTTLVEGAGRTGGTIFQPWQLFWPLGETGHVVIGGDGLPKPAGWRTPPAWLSPVTHPLIAASVLPLSLLWWRRRGAASGEHVLVLLAFLLLLRCVLDPWNQVYYAVPLLFSLLAWETLVRDRLPIVALLATVMTWATWQWIAPIASPDVQFVAYIAWAVPLGGWLARECFAVRRAPVPAAPRLAYART